MFAKPFNLNDTNTRAVLRLVWPPISSFKTFIRDLRRRSSILLQSARDRVATAA